MFSDSEQCCREGVVEQERDFIASDESVKMQRESTPISRSFWVELSERCTPIERG